LREELAGVVPDDIYQRAVRRANLKGQIEGIVVSAIRQILGQGVDSVQVQVEPVKSVREVNGKEEEVIEQFQWMVSAVHPELGELMMMGKIDAVQTVGQTSPTQTQTSGSSGNRRSNWAKVLELANRYGIEVRQYEREKLSWYVGVILSRIAKQRPEAQQDVEWQQLAQAWLAEKPQNAPGIKV
jgi:hypothetical protein